MDNENKEVVEAATEEVVAEETAPAQEAAAEAKAPAQRTERP